MSGSGEADGGKEPVPRIAASRDVGQARASGGGAMLAEPVGQVGFGQSAGGKGDHRAGGVGRIECQRHLIEREEQARQHPTGALVAIDEGMVADDTERIGRGQLARIILPISPLVDRTGQPGFEQPVIPNAGAAAMFGQLAIMNSQRHGLFDPDRFAPVLIGINHARLLRQHAQYVAIFPHNLFGQVHLGPEIGVGGGQPDTVGRLRDIEHVPRPDAQLGQQLLGQYDPGAIADLGDFEGGVHTKVITQLDGG